MIELRDIIGKLRMLMLFVLEEFLCNLFCCGYCDYGEVMWNIFINDVGICVFCDVGLV